MKRAQSNKTAQPTILIFTGSIGAGHVSVARAIAETLHRNGSDFHVEIIDLLTTLKNLATTTTKKIYLGSLKISPKIYELIFTQSAALQWPMKLFNAVSFPFLARKLYELLLEKKPKLLISTNPIWDIVIKKIWDKYLRKAKKNAPFVSVVTDSISIHRVWTLGQPDFFIVANEDTAVALKNLGIDEKRIKIFGYPVAHKFIKHEDCESVRMRLNLSPRKKTLLLILPVGLRWPQIKKLIDELKRCSAKNIQLVIVAYGGSRWKEKLEQTAWRFPTKVIGWTQEIHAYIHSADIVLTKAGGSTVMECIASGKPMIIIDALPGQEIGNAMLVQKYHLGVVLDRDCKNLDFAISHILKNESLIKKNLQSQQHPHAAEDIARFLIQLLRDGRFVNPGL